MPKLAKLQIEFISAVGTQVSDLGAAVRSSAGSLPVKPFGAIYLEVSYD